MPQGRENATPEALPGTLAHPQRVVGNELGNGDAVEDALAKALDAASAAGRWDVVAQLAKELEARRLARAGNVVTMARRAK